VVGGQHGDVRRHLRQGQDAVHVTVTDNGEAGDTDTFEIIVPPNPPEGGVLRSGNIRIDDQ
jgi:hypothetical protein